MLRIFKKVKRLRQSWSEKLVLFFHNNISAGQTSLLHIKKQYTLLWEKKKQQQQYTLSWSAEFVEVFRIFL